MFLIAWPFITFIFWYVFYNYFSSSAYNGKKPLSDRKIFLISVIVGAFVSFFSYRDLASLLIKMLSRYDPS